MQSLKKDGVTTQIHEIYIRADPEAIWEALTTPQWTARYGYRSAAEYDLKQGGKDRAKATQQLLSMGLPAVIIDGEVIEAPPPRCLGQTFRCRFSEENKSEGFPRVTWAIEPTTGGFCRLPVTHDLEGAP